jgi:hypothetical protein
MYFIDQGCQNFLGAVYQNSGGVGGKYQMTPKLLNGYTIYQMAVKYST